jgi:chromosome segregation ATPase
VRLAEIEGREQAVVTQEADLNRRVAEFQKTQSDELSRGESLADREADLKRRESELEKTQTGELGRLREQLEAREQELVSREALRQQLEARERELDEREAAFAEENELSKTALARIDKREKRIADTEATLRDRTRELDEREDEVEQREARYETDFDIRLEKLEAREQAVAELEEKLGAKENQLANYVAQAQGALQRRESEWWDKQLGSDDPEADVA